jgi:hypothetical protein
MSRPGYHLYCECVIPLLKNVQRLKHFTFAKHFCNNWGLGSGKYILIEYDKKWFCGLVMHRGAKSCADLGINPQSYSAYHKSHISKTMGMAFTAFAFKDSIENGGEAIKLGFFNTQSYKVAQQMVRESVHQPDGSMKQCGLVKQRKGDKYLVDCAITGSDPGNLENPKFPLIDPFCEYVFPKVNELVGPGGKYEDYVPIFQGDNAGPHQEDRYLKFVTDYCSQRG